MKRSKAPLTLLFSNIITLNLPADWVWAPTHKFQILDSVHETLDKLELKYHINKHRLYECARAILSSILHTWRRKNELQILHQNISSVERSARKIPQTLTKVGRVSGPHQVNVSYAWERWPHSVLVEPDKTVRQNIDNHGNRTKLANPNGKNVISDDSDYVFTI